MFRGRAVGISFLKFLRVRPHSLLKASQTGSAVPMADSMDARLLTVFLPVNGGKYHKGRGLIQSDAFWATDAGKKRRFHCRLIGHQRVTRAG